MPIELVPFEAAPNATYLSATEALARAAQMPGLTALLAQDEDALAALLLIASIDLDGAMPYQGRKYDDGSGVAPGSVLGVPQEREFPRLPDPSSYAYNLPGNARLWPLGIDGVAGAVGGGQVWDWDPTANDGVGGAVVPDMVKIACLYQAAWLLNPANSERLAAIRAGLAAQSTASLSETYRSPAEMAAMIGGGSLHPRAANIMEKYRLKTGRML